MRVLVCGSRGWTDAGTIGRWLHHWHGREDITIVHGDARGADRLAATIARGIGLAVEAHPAEWEGQGRRAGYIRNIEMLDSEIGLVLAFWDGKSRGTKHTIDEAEKRGIETYVVLSTLQEECGDAITHRNDEHEMSVCTKPAGHRSAHESNDCVWTDGEHWGEDEQRPALQEEDR